MADLRTHYMGIELKNPIIIGASNIVTDIDNLKRIEKAGAAAIVYKSLFEEQIQLENLELFERKTEYSERNAEMISLFPVSICGTADIDGTSNGIEEGKRFNNHTGVCKY